MGAGDSIKPVNLSACSLVLRSWPLRFEDESFAPTALNLTCLRESMIDRGSSPRERAG